MPLNEFQQITYIPKEQRKRILLLSDDARMTSGIGVVSREIILNTAQHFNWYQLGAAIKHPDEGKLFDLNDAIKNEMGIEDADVKIRPNSGYGNPDIIRHLLRTEKIDGIMHFTDPRFWIWLYQIEHEIRQQVPLMFYHIWDELPYPQYNAPYFESCDSIACISKQTHNIVKNVWQTNPPEPWQTTYLPHGIPSKYFFPIEENDNDVNYKRMMEIKTQLFGADVPEFVVMYNNRNIRRKLPGNIVMAFNDFIMNNVPEDKRSKCVLLFHTQPIDDNGTDLPELTKAMAPKARVVFSAAKIDSRDLNCLYNIADCVINMSNAEGWGLATTEAIMAGTPIIATVTGGLQDQMRFVDENGNIPEFNTFWPSNHDGRYKNCGDWVLPLFPPVRSITGSILTPYIAESFAAWEDAAAHMVTLYNEGRDARKARGKKGREWALNPESGMHAPDMGNNFIKYIDTTLQNWKPRKRFTLYNALEFDYKKAPEFTTLTRTIK